MHFRLYNRPAAFNKKTGGGTMWIDGVYEDYDAGEPYEGRVQIHGSVGLMKVEILDGNLPPSASVFIDQLTKEVVVKWSKYTPPTSEVKGVPNGDFENNSFWELIGPGTPATVETGWSPNNKGNLTYRDQKGEYIVRGAWAPVSSVNRNINITAKVEHGKSSKGNASCAIGLAWYDAERNLVREDWGNAVTNGGKGRWYDTKLMQASSDRLIKFVRPAIKFVRKKQNHPIHIGQVEWDHVYEVGYNEDEELWVLVKVTDSVHNTATHRGVIEENNIWLTSRPYPFIERDTFSSVGPILYDPVFKDDALGYGSDMATTSIQFGVTFKSVLADYTFPDYATTDLSVSVEMKDVMRPMSFVDNVSSRVGSVVVDMRRIAVDPGVEYSNATTSISMGVTLQ